MQGSKLPAPAVAEALHTAAYEAYGTGRLSEASGLFARLIETYPGVPHYHYMRGLVHKYLRDWPTSLAHNLESLALHDAEAEGEDEASLWNAGIAATAIGDWQQARRSWEKCGIALDTSEGPTARDLGYVSVRLNAWAQGETLYAHRFDVARAKIENVPLPESGFRFGDIVLHDGASTGSRPWGDGHVPVFNVLQRLEQSEFQTFAVFANCDAPSDAQALIDATAPGIGMVEGWTASMTTFCLRCSYGAPHAHRKDEGSGGDWERDRNFGVAAQSRAAVVRLLENWAAGSPATRRIDGVETRACAIPEPEDGVVWWIAPEDH